jgi:hypothetical protein
MNPNARPVNTPPQRTNWWERNWKWFVPTGCLGMLLFAAGLVLVVISIAFGALKSSDAYKVALAKAKALSTSSPRNLRASGPS